MANCGGPGLAKSDGIMKTLLLTLFAIFTAQAQAQVCATCQSIRPQNLQTLSINDGFSAVNEDYRTEGELVMTGASPGDDVLSRLTPNTTRPGPITTVPQPVTNCSAGQGMARQVCDQFNAFRRAGNLPEMFLDTRLNQIAEAYARKMASTGSFSHTDELGGPSERVSNAGIRWRGVAENIAQGQMSAEEVLNGWFQSPGHQKNMVSTEYNRHGIGYFQGYWVHLFLLE